MININESPDSFDDFDGGGDRLDFSLSRQDAANTPRGGYVLEYAKDRQGRYQRKEPSRSEASETAVMFGDPSVDAEVEAWRRNLQSKLPLPPGATPPINPTQRYYPNEEATMPVYVDAVLQDLAVSAERISRDLEQYEQAYKKKILEFKKTYNIENQNATKKWLDEFGSEQYREQQDEIYRSAWLEAAMEIIQKHFPNQLNEFMVVQDDEKGLYFRQLINDQSTLMQEFSTLYNSKEDQKLSDLLASSAYDQYKRNGKTFTQVTREFQQMKQEYDEAVKLLRSQKKDALEAWTAREKLLQEQYAQELERYRAEVEQRARQN